MKTKLKITLLSISIFILIFIGVFGYASIRFIRHEQWQNDEILNLRGEFEFLKAQNNTNFTDAELFVQACNENARGGGYNYLAIGNSITLHGLCDYWWCEYGMAASEPSKDYFHLVVDGIKKHKSSLVSRTCDFSIWEIVATDRVQTLKLLDPYLNSNLNLVTVQLGENAILGLNTFENDLIYLLKHIKERCPKAQIIVITDFWEYHGRDAMKISAAKKFGADIADIRAIKDNKEFMCNIGTLVSGDDGILHKVEHEGVAAHPGDKGMKYIAEKILELIHL